MDPNANLQAQERLLRHDRRLTSDDRAWLHDLRGDLKRWLAAGGFAPDWAACPLASVYFGHGVLAT